ncbi:Uncharacterised protein [Mycobacterium tuberculosis]|nr:Uncharacterised protein [Mycobacterium tuberculosis]COY33155.1 Uncharacterised protein [Mycobacterium tuberculosis]
MVVVLEPGLPPGLEEVHRRGHDLPGATVWVFACQMVGVEQHKNWLPSGSVNDEGDATALRPRKTPIAA